MKTAQRQKPRTLRDDAPCRLVRANVTDAQWRAISAGARRCGLSVADLVRSFLLPLFVRSEYVTPFDLRVITVVDGVVQARYIDQILTAVDRSYVPSDRKAFVNVGTTCRRPKRVRPEPRHRRCGRQWPTKAAIEAAIGEQD